jgi:RNA polymerase sigma-70 factor (ECF subfamily)
MGKINEMTLIRSVGEGSENAMKYLKDCYQDLISRIAFRIMCDRKDSNVVVQDVFNYVRTDSKAFDGSLSLRNWLLSQTCRYARIRLARRRIMYIFGERPGLYVTSAPKVQDYDDYVTTQAWELYCRTVGEFNVNQRILFALCTLEGMSEYEASLITGVSGRRICSLLDDAEAKFRKELRLYGKQDEYYSYIGFLRKVADG